jgi:hypothetical protein
LFDFTQILTLSTHFVKSNFTKIRQVGTDLVRAERQTDGQHTGMTKLIDAFREYANAPENSMLDKRSLYVSSKFVTIKLILLFPECTVNPSGCVVTLCTTSFNMNKIPHVAHTMHGCVLDGSGKEQR